MTCEYYQNEKCRMLSKSYRCNCYGEKNSCELGLFYSRNYERKEQEEKRKEQTVN